jgi:hypothetical protein
LKTCALQAQVDCVFCCCKTMQHKVTSLSCVLINSADPYQRRFYWCLSGASGEGGLTDMSPAAAPPSLQASVKLIITRYGTFQLHAQTCVPRQLATAAACTALVCASLLLW